MHAEAVHNQDQSARQNLKWLFLLRNFLIAGECFVMVFAVHILMYDIAEMRLWAILSIAAIVNSLTWYRLQHDFPVTELELFFHLVFDVMGITASLYFTGGANNPFSWFFILPLVIAATILPHGYTWFVLGLTSVCYTLLIGYHVALPNPITVINERDIPKAVVDLQSDYFADVRVVAMWFGFLLIAGLVVYFVIEMSNTLRERDKRLAEVRENTLRNERIVALGTLAAGAAHEMGTPLGTMAIVAHDLEQEYSGDEFKDLRTKMGILREQIGRCKKALSVMSATAGEMRAESGSIMPLNDYLQDVILQWRDQRPGVQLNFGIKSADETPKMIAEQTLTHALINILNNAADVSPQWIELRADWNQTEIIIEIMDKGPGINPEVFESAGKKPISTKRQGLGVGLFLAYSTIDRLGGSLKMFNRPDCGACTMITLPSLNA